MIKQIFILLLALSTTPLVAQDNTAYKAFDQVLATYQSGKTINYKVAYTFYALLEKEIAFDSLDITITQKGENIFLDMEDQEILYWRGKTLVINHPDKQILLQNGKTMPLFSIEQMKENITALDMNFEQKDTAEGLKVLQMSAPNQSNTTMELTYDPNNHQIISTQAIIDSEANYKFKNTKLVGNYSAHQISNDRFPYAWSDFVQKVNGNYQGIKGYKDYKLVVLN